MTGLDRRAEEVRSFNRFYTRHIGLLRLGYLNSPFSLTEMRALYELAHQEGLTAAALCRELDLDAGYLSRMLKNFEKHGWLQRKRASGDGRQSVLAMTRSGRAIFAPYDAKAHAETAAMLAKLSPDAQRRLMTAMHSIEKLLGSQPEPSTPYILRQHQPGDIGWVIHRHGALYTQEYGWDERFEALVAEIAARFIQRFDSKRERCWIAEKDGDIVGSIFLVKKTKSVAKLRLLLVEPSARGLGIGARLVDECIRFARQAGYKKITLWTQNVLHSARRIYQRAGFQLVHEEPNRDLGHDLKAQTWDLIL